MRSGATPVSKADFSPSQPGSYVAIYVAIFLALPLNLSTGRETTPPTPEKPWAPPGLDAYARQLTNQNPSAAAEVVISPAKTYDLPELIDIAQRSHPETRTAWERAQQAASAVGLSQSAYYPYLAASAAANYQHGVAVFLTSVAPASAAQKNAGLDLQWLLFDFGERKAAVAAAKERLMMANVSFNATHQQIVFAVTRSFYDFNTARQKVAVAESSLRAAQTVGAAAQARFDHGLATKTDLLQAQQQTAQADYALTAARGDLSDAQVALVDSLGVLPTTKLQVAEVPEKAFDENFSESLDALMDRALTQRPDLVAKLAKVRANQAEVKKARADFYPKVSLGASGGWMKLDVNAYDSPYIGNSRPSYAAGVAIELPIFDGFLRANKLKAAQSDLRAAQSELENSRDSAVREVWKTYTNFQTALQKQAAAAKFLEAAQSAFDAALESYRQGLGTYVAVANAQQNLDTARSVAVNTRAAIFTSSAALALSVGDLAKPEPAAPSTRPQP